MSEKTLEIAAQIVRKWEGFSPMAYKCPADVWTIGYGRTQNVAPGDTTTREDEEAYLMDTLIRIQKQLDRLVNVPLNKNQNAALLSFCYNVGTGAFRKSTLLALLNKGLYDDASAQFARWNKSGGKVLKGLVNRREDEANLFCKP